MSSCVASLRFCSVLLGTAAHDHTRVLNGNLLFFHSCVFSQKKDAPSVPSQRTRALLCMCPPWRGSGVARPQRKHAIVLTIRTAMIRVFVKDTAHSLHPHVPRPLLLIQHQHPCISTTERSSLATLPHRHAAEWRSWRATARARNSD
jgi:hypothetical protein